MEFLFHNDGAELIRKELTAPERYVERLVGKMPTAEWALPELGFGGYVKFAKLKRCKKTSRYEEIEINGEIILVEFEGEYYDCPGGGRGGAGPRPGGGPTEPGGTGTGTGVNLDPSKRECQVERHEEAKIDAAANAVADIIKGLYTPASNPGNFEYGAFLIRLPNGDIVAAYPTEGDTASTRMALMLADAKAEFGNWVTGADIVGIVHLHPAEFGPGFADAPSLNDLSPLDLGTTMPSHPLVGVLINGLTGEEVQTDWAGGREYLENNGHANVDKVSHYIIGPDGVVREYDYSDPHPAEGSEQYDDIREAAEDAKVNREC